MPQLKDLITGKELIAIALIISATTMVCFGAMTVDQWKEFSTYIFGFYASAKAFTLVGTAAFSRSGRPADPPAATTPTPTPPAPAQAVAKMFNPSPTAAPTPTAPAPTVVIPVAAAPSDPTASAPATPGTLATAATVAKTTPILVLALICGMLLGNSGCGANARLTTIRASLAVATSAKSAFHAFEAQHELDIVKNASSRADADAKLLAYYSKRTKFNSALNVLFAAIATAATLSDDQSLAAIVTAATNLNAIVKDIETIDGKAVTP